MEAGVMKSEALVESVGPVGTVKADVFEREGSIEDADNMGKRLCIQDESGRMFFLHIDANDAGQLFGLKVGPPDQTKSTSDEKRRRRRERKEKKAIVKSEPIEGEDAEGFDLAKGEVQDLEMREDVEGYDPATGEVHGPEGQPIGPGNGSVVIREINSEKDINQAWFTTKEDKSALSDKGLNWKQGTWSSEEVALLNSNIFNYCHRRGIEDPVEIIFDMSKDERKDFYRCVSRGLQRPLFSVYRRVIRMYDAKNHIGKYTDDEVDKLKNLRQEFGSDWAKIGAAMGRSAASVKDRCRLLKDDCKSGKWEEEEEQRLIDAVHSVTDTENGTSVTSNVPWSQVATMVNTRSEKQCRTKWLNFLNWKQAGGNRDWGRRDELLLVTKIARLGDLQESTIDWISMTDGWSAVRSPQWLRNKWLALKRTLPQYQTLTLREACKMLLDDVSRCSATGSRVLRNSLPGRVDAGNLAVSASRSASSLFGNDFWGVGEDSNGAASTSDIVNGIATENVMPTLESTQGSSLIRPPTFSIHSDLGSHLLIDGSGLHLPVGTSLSGGVGGETLQLALGNSETYHLSSTDGIVTSTAIDVELPPTTAFPAFANVLINGEDVNDGMRSDLTSPARDSPISRDVILTADRDSRSPFLHCDDVANGTIEAGTTMVSPRLSTVSTDDDDDEDGTFVVTPSGHLIPYSKADSIGRTLTFSQAQGLDVSVQQRTHHRNSDILHQLPPPESLKHHVTIPASEHRKTAFSIPQLHQTTLSLSPQPPTTPSASPLRSGNASRQLQHASHRFVVGADVVNDELISDLTTLGETECEVVCVDDGFVQIGESPFIPDSDFLVVDGGIVATHDGDDDDDDNVDTNAISTTC